jgi:hypothetical protein
MDTNRGDSWGRRSCLGGAGSDAPAWQGGGATSPELQPPVAGAPMGDSRARTVSASRGVVPHEWMPIGGGGGEVSKQGSTRRGELRGGGAAMEGG